MVEKEYVVKMFNEMNEDYDDLKDLWYSWLFSRLHYFIANDVILPIRPKRVLDIGCGTGFQSFLYALTGSEVVGIDIADKLVDIAKEKAITYIGKSDFKLFPSHYFFADEYNEKMYILLKEYLNYKAPKFEVVDASTLCYPNESFDHVNICGSVINFVDDYENLVSESQRVLKSGGTLFLEFDTKWNPDIFWTIIDSLLLGKFDYEMSFLDAVKNVIPPFAKHIELDYPFGDIKNPVIMKMKLFSNSEIKKLYLKKGFQLKRYRTIHSITNLIPSTVLDTERPSKNLIRCFNLLRKVEELDMNLPGCSSIMLFKKEG